MSKPTKTEAELVRWQGGTEGSRDCSDGSSFPFFATAVPGNSAPAADEATIAKPGYPECVALIVQIGDHLSKQFDVS